MDNTLYLLAGSMDSAAQNQQRLAKNLSNTSSPGFKEVFTRVESETSSGEIPYSQNFLSFSQGSVVSDEDPHSFAISGDGFIEVVKDDEVAYVRSGYLYVNNNNELTTSEGRVVQGIDGAIIVPQGQQAQIKISEEGVIQAGERELGTLKLMQFSEPHKLINEGGTFWNPAKVEANVDKDSRVLQGHIEKSTVNNFTSMKDLVANMRYFETINKVTQTVDRSWQNLLQNGR
ncbi:flagellar basal body rod C-terminal domain-containing protein [Candidatus Uabimicrobium amorphum]|uniref:Flagellar basal-body rod protein FlgF n=1 Tax=Uabimicrobium amorphum TaxID=2596890 RepID=A0A5S9IN71_UABAM|nr:flagellar basal body rod C-terminal domain-containing protein [Candidatus Uabimicrobium amorphum]BBM84988.1 flagellar basal-body rod protein FlgF [Candidatus Uabimicrobium amorphum]